ncbi:MAG: polysulfide reductase NrfD [Bacteroidetes bacterium]|nr:polysulfide reductase NrfD [Bacteroidota bacterium]
MRTVTDKHRQDSWNIEGGGTLAVDPKELREPLVEGKPVAADVTETVSRVVESKPTKLWYGTVTVTSAVAGWGILTILYTVFTGIGVWGNNQPVGWAWDITNFVFWIGIGHAGTLISAILFLFRQKWRTAINRAAEAMTIFAVICALIFPIIHTGRPWVAVYWLLPLPNQMQMWVNFRSPLLWDVFAVSTYFAVSAMFWFVGLVPDFATLRNRAKNKIAKMAFTFFSMGWTGANRHWHRYEKAYLIMAGISTPLVLSVHTIVSFDFAVSVIPGWHTTIFPPYFVAGAIFSGFGMVLTLMILARKLLNLEQFITIKHIENMSKVLMATGLMVGYAYGIEFFIAWYSGNPYERFVFINRAFGPYSWAYWTMVSCNVFIPQLFWFRGIRRNLLITWIISIFVNIGMWFERFVIIVTSLHRDFLPSSWGMFTPTWVDVSIFAGTVGLFLTLFLVFAKYLPVLAISEVKGILPGAQPKHGHH